VLLGISKITHGVGLVIQGTVVPPKTKDQNLTNGKVLEKTGSYECPKASTNTAMRTAMKEEQAASGVPGEAWRHWKRRARWVPSAAAQRNKTRREG